MMGYLARKTSIIRTRCGDIHDLPGAKLKKIIGGCRPPTCRQKWGSSQGRIQPEVERGWPELQIQPEPTERAPKVRSLCKSGVETY